MKLLTKVLLAAVTLLVVAEFLPGVSVDSVYTALIAALILGLLNFFVRPILLILTFPITIVTLGLFIFVINAVLFWFAASFIEGFVVSGFLWALLGSLVISIVSTIGNKYI